MRKVVCLSILFVFCLTIEAKTLKKQLESLKGVERVEQIAGGYFKEKYVVYFRQLRQPDNPKAGTFLQRVIVGHQDKDSAVVLHTHGYNAADHQKRITVRDELSDILDCNDIFIEHRYFGESCPKDTNWNEVTTYNAAYDMHVIIKQLKKIYKHKWISTGGSKDGITSTLLSMYFPKDIDVAVPYVAPFCLTTADPRGYEFMRTVGTPQKRQRIYGWQKEALKRRETLQPMVEHYADSVKMRFTVPFEMIYDYCILDYDFGIWMRGISEDSIPLPDATNEQMYKHFIKYANPDMFDRNNMPHQTYYVQSAKELGNYAYDFSLFEGLLSPTTLTHGYYLEELYLPEGDWDFSYTDATRKKVMDFLRHTSCKLIFIYGETDTWTAFRIPDFGNENVRVYVVPGGCHYSKIRQLNEPEQTEVIELLKSWINK